MNIVSVTALIPGRPVAQPLAAVIIIWLARAARLRTRPSRRGGRVAEGGGLLNRYTVKSCIGGSNPPLSASIFILFNLTCYDTFGDTLNRRCWGQVNKEVNLTKRVITAQGSPFLPRRHHQPTAG